MKMLFRAALLATLPVLTSTFALGANVVLNGAGATFPAPIYTTWIAQYEQSHPSLHIEYQAIGSGGGIRQILEGNVDFGATDGPMNDVQLRQFEDTHGYKVLHIPTVLGADVPAYNLPGIHEELNFTPEVLAGIFLGKITKWDDSELRKANPNVSLPNAQIIVIHRSDGSGTSYIWTDYLSKVSDEWRNRVGKGTSVNWPVGLSARGNDGVTGIIAKTPNALGYVELSYAMRNNLAYGRVRNSSGSFVKADLASISAAATGAARNFPGDFRVSIVDAPGENAYPISSFTWLLIPARVPDVAKRKAMTELLKWMLTEGQSKAASLSYASLPKAVADKELMALSKLQ
jgi:phosphate transport system substrate-binding protein